MNNRTAVYTRYSSDKQSDLSIEDQIKECRAFTKKNGLNVVKVYSDYAKTGTNENREDFQNMMNDARKGLFDYIVVWHTDRIHRDMIASFRTLGIFQELGIEILSVTQPELNSKDDISLLIRAVYSWKDAQVSADISKNVARTMRTKAENCEYMGYKVYGYDHDANKKFVINDEEARIVEYVFASYASGQQSLKEIADALNGRGLRNPSGKPFNYNYIERIIKNEAYVGRYYYKGRLIKEDGYPRIINFDLFMKAQAKLSRKRRKNMSSDYALTSKLFCSVCGEPMHGISGKGKQGYKYYYYACKDKWVSCATEKAIPQDMIEELVSNAILSTFSEPETSERLIEKLLSLQENHSNIAEIKAVRKSLEEVRRQQKKLLDSIGNFPSDLFDKKAAELSKRHSELEIELMRLEADTDWLTREELVAFFADIKKSGLTPKEVIKHCVSKVVMYPDKVVIVTNLSDADHSLREIERAISLEGSSYDASGLEKRKEPLMDKGSSNSRMVSEAGFEPAHL